MHADRTNRTALILFGLLILVIGAGGLTTSVGVYGQGTAHDTLFANRVSEYIGQHAWVWYIVAAICVLILAVVLRWIVALLISTDRAGDIPVPVATREGTTILRPAALTGALTREISTYRGVEGVHGRIIGDGGAPEIVLAVTATQATDLHALYERIENEALAHARQVLGQSDLPVQLDLAISRTS